jgi:hypothetical protein
MIQSMVLVLIRLWERIYNVGEIKTQIYFFINLFEQCEMNIR